MSRPLNRYVSFVCVRPSRCNIVACRSWTDRTCCSALIPNSSRAPITWPAVKHLNESHSVLNQPACQQALPAKWLRDLLIHPVQFARGFGFVAQIHGLRRAALHSECEFVRGNACSQLRVARIFLQVLFVELP